MSADDAATIEERLQGLGLAGALDEEVRRKLLAAVARQRNLALRMERRLSPEDEPAILFQPR